ncbi:MAG: hypothetical protein R2880_16125 [Deinococcales bacterium]
MAKKSKKAARQKAKHAEKRKERKEEAKAAIPIKTRFLARLEQERRKRHQDDNHLWWLNERQN